MAINKLPLKKITIVIVNSDLEFGGAQRQIVELANNLDKEKFNVYICSLADYVPLADSLIDADKRLIIIKKYFKFDLTVIFRLALFLKHVRADVVHSYLFDSQIMCRLAGFLLRRPVIIGSERNTDYQFKKRHLFAYWLTKGMVDLTIANSNAGARFNSKMLGHPMAHYHVVHNGVDITRFRPFEVPSEVRKTVTGYGARPIVGMFASFKPQKNHLFLIECIPEILKTVPDACFLFVGDELYKGMSGSVEYKNAINRAIESRNLGTHCIFAGNQQRTEDWYNLCTITVLPSFFEGTPNVVLESMSCGVPVVATDVSDNSLIIKNGKTGYVISLNDKDGFVKRVAELLTDHTLHYAMRTEARKWVCSEFSNKRLAEKTGAIYQDAFFYKNRVSFH